MTQYPGPIGKIRDPGPLRGTWDLGHSTWDPSPGTRDPGPGTLYVGPYMEPGPNTFTWKVGPIH